LQGDPQWHAGVDPASAEARVRGRTGRDEPESCIVPFVFRKATARGMNLQWRVNGGRRRLQTADGPCGGLRAA